MISLDTNATSNPHAHDWIVAKDGSGKYCPRCNHYKCEACDYDARPGDTYCKGHARLMEYTDHEASGGIAAND